VHELFQLKNTTGLTDALTAPTDRQLPARGVVAVF